MPITEEQELQKYRGFDNETLSVRLAMTKRAIGTIADKNEPGFGLPPSMKRSLQLLVVVARERGILKGRRR